MADDLDPTGTEMGGVDIQFFALCVSGEREIIKESSSRAVWLLRRLLVRKREMRGGNL